MVTVVALVMGLGICLLVCTGIIQLMRLSDLRALRVLRRTVPTPVGSWVGGAGRVAAEGITDDGPAGPQTGPVSGERCAWYRVTLVREPSRGWSDDTDEPALIDVASPGPPMLADATGRVALDPRLFEKPSQDEPWVTRTTTLVHRRAQPVELPAIVPAELIQDLRRGESLRLEEVRLPYAQEVYALALPVGAPVMLMPNPQGVTVFTTETREQVIARRRESIATAQWVTRGFGLTGLIVTVAAYALLTFVLST